MHQQTTTLILLGLSLFLVASFTVGQQIDPENVKFELFTRLNSSPQILKVGDLQALQQSNYNSSRSTKIMAHGLNGGPSSFYTAVFAYLNREDCNAISVDWSILAAGSYDFVAVNGVPVAGATTGSFIDFLVQQGTPLSAFHLTGFSFGGQVVGIAAENVKSPGKLARITGLDPASYLFDLSTPDGRLDATDADFVDIIHTDIAYINAMGHADFYPNGGLASQPGCSPATDSSAMGFRSLLCPSYAAFVNGSCNANEAVLMGEPTPNTARGSYYLATNAASPYALG